MSKTNYPGGDDDFRDLKDRLKKDSFRVKRILLELPNYSYYHSVMDKDSDDKNNRFVGRKAIIDRIKSFVHETSKNTGTYLVTGFRGMGKTSVVNKALSTLNPTSYVQEFLYLWLFLIPCIVYLQEVLNVFDFLWKIKNIFFPSALAITILVIYYLGHKSPLRPKRNSLINTNSSKPAFTSASYQLNKLIYGLMSLYQGKFYKHKFKFQRLLVYVTVYSWTVLLYICVLKLGFMDLGDNYQSLEYARHLAFWHLTISLYLIYITYDLYLQLMEYYRVNGGLTKKSRIWSQIDDDPTLIIASGFIVTFLVYFIKTLIFPNQLITVFIVTSVWYALAKIYFSKRSINSNSSKYKTVLQNLVSFFDLQHYITVKVNLGKDKLTEKDVLKYVANELYNEYKTWYFKIRDVKRLINILLIGFLLFIFSSVIVNTFLNTEFLSFSENKLQIAAFFPSQALIDKNLHKRTETTDNINDNVRFENILAKDAAKETKGVDQYIRRIQEVNRANTTIKIGYQSLIRLNDTTIVEKIDFEPVYDKTNYSNGRDSINLTNNKNPNLKTGFNDNREITSFTKEFSLGSQSLTNKVIVSIALFCNEVDYIFIRFWNNVREVLVHNHIRNIKNETVRNLIDCLYPKIPVLTVYITFFLLLLPIRVLPSKMLLLKTHYRNLKELKNLNKQIDASIQIEQGGASNSMGGSIFNYAKKTNYKPLEAKDITQKLIYVLDDVASIPSIFVRLRFIFIFDELDKINTHFSTSIANIEDEFDTANTEVRYRVRRKERIGRILSSMKHFLNSAKAKFIFIAGREMYDAALAGISDRESSLDSIFNDNKIYVNSFYKEGDDNNLADITSITEQYLCQFLIPESYKKRNHDSPSLTMYNAYLKELDDEFKDNSEEFKIRKAQRFKVIMTLKDFIVYLTYRSNGAPRKLSNLIEQYITPVSNSDFDSPESRMLRIVVGKNNENPFLKIGYYDQYKFGLVSYLTSPVFMGIGNYVHEYSDKLLVSISYMLDHLFKHHKFGISFRSLSLTPEIVDINKEPQFREFLDKLIDLLSKNHLRSIVSGIYDYKFNGLITSEIKLLSKIDEYEAAAFNFTLDESIELKRHFNRRLESLKSNVEKIIVSGSKGKMEENYVNSISLLHMMIGDLHFYDEEYQESIVHFLDAIQLMRQRNFKEMNHYDFMLYVRNKLKLGLAFEKNKMFDNALMTFSELTDLITRKRNIALRKIGLARFVITKKEYEAKKYQPIFSNVSEETLQKIELKFEKSNSKEIVIIGRLKGSIIKSFKQSDNVTGYDWKKLYDFEDMVTFYGIEVKDVMNINLENIETNIKPIKNYFLLSTGENIRLLYQPIIAKLHLIEKTSPDKVKEVDILRSINEFNFIKSPLQTEAKRVIVAEFYNKIGDLLYFKNGTLHRTIKYRLKEIIKTGTESKKNEAKEVLMAPIDACLFYIKSLAVLLCSKVGGGKTKENRPIDFIKFYNYGDISNAKKHRLYVKDHFFTAIEADLRMIRSNVKNLIDNDYFKHSYSAEYLSSVANGLTDLASTLLAFNGRKYNRGNTQPGNEPLALELCQLLQLEFSEILNLYHYASIIYNSIGESRLARSQNMKLLYIMMNAEKENLEKLFNKNSKYYLHLVEKGDPLSNDKSILENFAIDTINLAENTYNQSSFVEKKKIKSIFKDEYFDDMLHDYSGSVVGSEVEEVRAMYHLILLRMLKHHSELKKHDNLEGKSKASSFFSNTITYFTKFESIEILEGKVQSYIKNSVQPNSIVRRKYNRILNLILMASYNHFVYGRGKKLQQTTHLELNAIDKQFLIVNSIGAYNEIIKSNYLFGINYVTTNHMDMGKAHSRMAFWCKELDDEAQTGIKTEHSTLRNITQEFILNAENDNYLDKEYHYKLALDYANKSLDFHTRGAALQQLKKSVSYLDDFYNDNLVHFSIAMERNQLLNLSNFNSIRAEIELNIKKCSDTNYSFEI